MPLFALMTNQDYHGLIFSEKILTDLVSSSRFTIEVGVGKRQTNQEN